MPTHHQIKIALIGCLVLAIAGCGTAKTRMYEGAELPPEQTATIKTSYHKGFWSSFYSRILQIDGKDIKVRSLEVEVEVLPGKHKITYMITMADVASISGPRTFTIQVEAGHVYRLDGDFYWVSLDWRDNIAHLWIVDETTGVEVAAYRPERPEIPEPIEHEPF